MPVEACVAVVVVVVEVRGERREASECVREN